MLFHAKRRKKNQDDQKRRMIIKMMSSFAVTAVVAAVIVFAPTPALAKFENVNAFGNEIYYETYVQDTDSTITEGSLKVVIESQLTTIEESIDLGTDSGAILDLLPNTVYTVSIKAKRGYGEETLAYTTVTTESGYGGRISEINLTGTSVDQWDNRLLTYQVTTVYNDLYQEISALRLKYVLISASEYHEMQDMGYPLDYVSIDINNQMTITTIPDVYDSNMMIIMIFEADLLTGETIILHERTFTTPLAIVGSIYVADTTPSSITATVYADYSIITDLVYQVSLIKNGEAIQTYTLANTAGESEWLDFEVFFDNLTLATLYHIRLEATFLNPETNKMETRVVRQIDIETSPMYDSIVLFDDLGTSIYINVTLTDPLAILSNIRYEIFEIDASGNELFLSSQAIPMSVIVNGESSGSISVSVPLVATYLIRITADKTYNGFYFYGTTIALHGSNE
ncbi:MAG: hypothetical protein WCS48_05250 [Candidatus Izemoplasmatales bacterium]